MSWHVYEIGPIDFNWQHLPTVEATAMSLAAQEASALVQTGRTTSIDGISSSEFLNMWKSAKDAASSEGWDGDFRIDPVVMWVPLDDQFRPGFVLKQDNNGTTYVVSPTSLPHLED